MTRTLLLALAAAAAAVAFVIWPVCVPLSDEQLSAFQPPIGERTETYLFGRVFQQRDGQWHQCKTRVARAMFF